MRFARAAIAILVVCAASCAGARAADELVETDPDVLRKVRRLVEGTLDSNDETQKKAWTELKDMGNLATPALATLAQQKDVSAPALNTLLIALGDSKDPRSAGALLTLLHAEKNSVRKLAARALGQSKSAAALKPLEELAADPSTDEDLRYVAAVASAKLKSEKAGEALRVLANSKSPAIRARAVFAMGKYCAKLEPARTVAAVQGLLNDPEDNVREECVNALRLAGGRAAQGALIKALDDDNFRIRGAAMDALRELTLQKFGNDTKAWKDWWAKNKKNRFEIEEKDKKEIY
jgi:HEAT repeat protein